MRNILCSADKPYDTMLEASVPDNVGVINSSVILNCTANANPAVIAYNIYHNGILVSNSSTGIHNITHAIAEHNGSYVCIPYNAFGPGERAALNVSFVGKSEGYKMFDNIPVIVEDCCQVQLILFFKHGQQRCKPKMSV